MQAACVKDTLEYSMNTFRCKVRDDRAYELRQSKLGRANGFVQSLSAVASSSMDWGEFAVSIGGTGFEDQRLLSVNSDSSLAWDLEGAKKIGLSPAALQKQFAGYRQKF